MDLFAELAIIALAVWQTVEVIHHSEIFQKFRTGCDEIIRESKDPFQLFRAKLVRCPFCLSHWVAFFYVLCYISAPELVFYWLLILAVVRLANLGNDLSYNYNRTPKNDPAEEEE